MRNLRTVLLFIVIACILLCFVACQSSGNSELGNSDTMPPTQDATEPEDGDATEPPTVEVLFDVTMNCMAVKNSAYKQLLKLQVVATVDELSESSVTTFDCSIKVIEGTTVFTFEESSFAGIFAPESATKHYMISGFLFSDGKGDFTQCTIYMTAERDACVILVDGNATYVGSTSEEFDPQTVLALFDSIV